LGQDASCTGTGDVVALEASLVDPAGAIVATATATARVIPLADAKTAV
jgi:hypothetical protein